MKKIGTRREAKFNKLVDQINDKALQYNELLEELNALRQEWHSEMEGYYEERSERWQQSEKGMAYEEWKETWGCFLGDEVHDLEVDDYKTEPEEV